MGKIVRPQRSLDGMVELDMRVSPLRGPELKVEIVESVAATQRFVMQTLPNRLVINQAQFDSLVAYTDEMYGTQDRIFQTPHNVMEVMVKHDNEAATTAQDDLERMIEDEQLKPAEPEEETFEDE